MNKKEALSAFYAKNKIDIRTASNPQDGNYDKRIAELDSQVNIWLQGIAPEDQEAFLTLLSRYTYLTETQCQLRYEKILSLLNEQLSSLNCQLHEVLFVTVESGGNYKSGSDNVRADFHKRNLREIQKTQIITAQSRLKNNAITQYKAIVFIDDIVGSGKTLWHEIKTFCKRFPQIYNGNRTHKLFYACIVPRKHGIKHIRDNCRKYHIAATEVFDKDWYEEPAIKKDSPLYQNVEKYEKIVGEYLYSQDGKSFFMGFEKNRLLVSFHYNTPNNTLSTFWRLIPEQHTPLFYRDGDQPGARPTIKEMRQKKRSLSGLAYIFGKQRQRKYRHGR